MSSMVHRGGRLVLDDLMFDRRRYSRWQAYSQSKLANLLFTLELQRRLDEAGPGRSRWPHTQVLLTRISVPRGTGSATC
jgi:NAD(P)-dependent dehydrogenase (short-subunit alcohol dehydrogenase family)